MSSGFLKIHQGSAFWIEMWNQNINLLPYLYYCMLYTYKMINKCSTQSSLCSNEVSIYHHGGESVCTPVNIRFLRERY